MFDSLTLHVWVAGFGCLAIVDGMEGVYARALAFLMPEWRDFMLNRLTRPSWIC
jgi:hypothetical protein